MAFYLYRKWRQHQLKQRDNVGVPAVEEPTAEPKQRSPEDYHHFAGLTIKRETVKMLGLLVAIAIPVYLETLDYTVVATAQPLIASHFNRLDLQSYIGTVYLLTSTVFLPFFASIADVYGRHFALQLSLFLFFVGSAISTGAVNMPMMLAGRGIAGVGASGLLTLPRILLADTNSLTRQSAQTNIIFFLYAIGFATGPIIGGALTTVSFRWIFAINLPTSVLAMFLAFVILRGRYSHNQDVSEKHVQLLQGKNRIQKILSLDWIGTALFVGAGILVLLALNWGSVQQWSSTKVIVSFTVGGVLFLLCVAWEVYVHHRQEVDSEGLIQRIFPMLPLIIFTSFDVVSAEFVSFAAGMVMLVMFYNLSIFYTIVTGGSLTHTGVQLLYFAPGMGAGSLLAQAIIRRTKQPKVALIFATAILTIALGLISQGVKNGNNSMVQGTLVMAGAGVGLSFGPAAIHARFSQPVNRIAIVSAYQRFFQTFGGTIGLAQAAAILNSKVTSYLIARVKSGAISATDAEALASSSITSVESIAALPAGLRAVVQAAFRDGTRWLFISLIPWAGVAFFLTLGLSRITTNASPAQTTPDKANKDEADVDTADEHVIEPKDV